MNIKFLFNFSKYEKIILLIIFSIYINNLFIDIMNVDAAQYASISLEMLHNHSYLQVMDLQCDYLDKPPLLFWISSISLGLFGVSNFAYKLGAFLMLLLSLYSIFRFTSIFYSQQIAKNAVLIPPAALRSDHVFIVQGEVARRRQVTVGVQGPRAVEIRQGIAAGDVVVLDPPQSLRDGQALRLKL